MTWVPWSGLRVAAGREDDLSRRVDADTELVRDLVRPESLLVVDAREPFLPRRPWAASGRRRRRGRRGRRLGGGSRPSGGAGSTGGGRGLGVRDGGAERAPPLVTVSAAREILGGALIQDHELIGGLVHPDGHHGQALGVFLLAFRSHAVVVFLCSLGMQFGPARDALRHNQFSSRTNVCMENARGPRSVPAGRAAGGGAAAAARPGTILRRALTPAAG